MLSNEKIKPGTILTINTKEEVEGRIRSSRKQVKVIRQYPHHVLVQPEGGHRFCITHAELMQNGIITQRMVETP